MILDYWNAIITSNFQQKFFVKVLFNDSSSRIESYSSLKDYWSIRLKTT